MDPSSRVIINKYSHTLQFLRQTTQREGQNGCACGGFCTADNEPENRLIAMVVGMIMFGQSIGVLPWFDAKANVICPG